jgi:hypothetical protein
MFIDEFKSSSDVGIGIQDMLRIATIGFDPQIFPIPSGLIAINPQICLQYSSDGGFTWSNERWKPLGSVGKFKHTVAWDRLGAARDRVFKVVIMDPVKVVIDNCFIEIEDGTN